MVKRLVICGSPRARGRSAVLADGICATYKKTCPSDEIVLISLADVRIAPCTGCGACESTRCDRAGMYCVIADDMARMYALLNECDSLCVVSPVYFAGVPAQLKAVLDRLQPYFWSHRRFEKKRPAEVYVVGEGGDPHGFGPLVGTVRSALAVAGFELGLVHDWVGLLREGSALPVGIDVAGAGRVHPAGAYTCVGPDGSYPQLITSSDASDALCVSGVSDVSDTGEGPEVSGCSRLPFASANSEDSQ